MTTTPWTSSSPDTQKTEYDKRKMPKHPWWTFGGNDPEAQKLIKGAMEKGASSWLSALPIKAIGYALNKQEFTDAICMRYGWKVKGIPIHCACGETNSVNHSIKYKLDGYTSMRHNSVRDSEAQIMREVCRDVQTEPTLLPINENDYQRKVNTLHCWPCKVKYLCERIVEQLWENFLWHKHHTSYLTVIFWDVPGRGLPTTWKGKG